MKPNSHTATSLLPLLIAAVAVGLLTLLTRRYLQYDGIKDDVGVWGGFFTVFGVIYAIVAGFLLVEVLGRFGRLTNTIEAELNAVECLRDYLIYLGDKSQRTHFEIRRSLVDYLISVRDQEWSEMSSKTGMVDSDTSEELYEVMRSIKIGADIAGAGDAVFSTLAEKLSDITVHRTLRISLANQSLPNRLKLLLIFMGAVLTIGFLMMPVANIYIHILMTATLTMSIALLSMIIEDLDHPFYGVWNLSRDALEKLIQGLQAELQKAPIGETTPQP